MPGRNDEEGHGALSALSLVGAARVRRRLENSQAQEHGERGPSYHVFLSGAELHSVTDRRLRMSLGKPLVSTERCHMSPCAHSFPAPFHSPSR